MDKRIRKALIAAGLAGTTLVGGAVGAGLLNGTAGAQESGTAATTDTTAAAAQAPGQAPGPPPGRPAMDPSKGGHQANGVTEELLTGDTAEKVTAAALAAVPGGTVERVETDAEGAAYEAHVTDADGGRVTVKLDASFAVSAVETGRR